MRNRWTKFIGAGLIALVALAASTSEAEAQGDCDSCEPYDYGSGGGGNCLTCTPCGSVIIPIGPCGTNCSQHSCSLCSVGSSCSAFAALEPGTVVGSSNATLVTYGEAVPVAVTLCAIALKEQEDWLAASPPLLTARPVAIVQVDPQ